MKITLNINEYTVAQWAGEGDGREIKDILPKGSSYQLLVEGFRGITDHKATLHDNNGNSTKLDLGDWVCVNVFGEAKVLSNEAFQKYKDSAE